ncbi:hypothetical protein L210DRAFT_3370723, partial [Boletus edulis BED1]
GVYRCSDCFNQPLFCTPCIREQHRRNPFHRVQQWTGSFFEDSSLNLVGTSVLPHDRLMYPSSSWPLSHSDYLTIVDVTGVHFITVNYCHCPGSLPVHQQLLGGGCFQTLQRPGTAFTFHVLDDFIGTT